MKYKNLLFPIYAVCLLLCAESFAECNPNGKTAGHDEYSDGKYSYECNVKNMCLGDKFGGGYWNLDTSKQIIGIHDATKYPDLNKEKKIFDEIKTIYQTTQDNIFECAVLKSKYAAHTQIIKDYDPSKKSKEYLEKLNQDIKNQLKQKKCLSPDQADKVYNYKDLHDSTSYEECVYSMYIHYYAAKTENSIGMLLGEDTGYRKSVDISRDISEKRTMLGNELKITQESLTTALKEYKNFHENYVPKVLLDLIYIELAENKTFFAKISHGIKQLVSLFTGAQKQSN